MLSLELFAQAPKAVGSPFDRPEIIYGSAALAGALLVGAVLIYLVDRWRKRIELEDQIGAGGELTNYRAMYEQGEITEAEYVRLRDRVANRVKAPPSEGAGQSPAARPEESSSAPPHPPITGPLPEGYFDDPPPPADPPPGENPPA